MKTENITIKFSQSDEDFMRRNCISTTKVFRLGLSDLKQKIKKETKK